MVKAPNPHAGAFCLATFFSQLPPDFVETAISASNEPEGAQEHYDQILASCGGDENATATVTQCLEQVFFSTNHYVWVVFVNLVLCRGATNMVISCCFWSE
jgi:hypothetical protein